MNRRIFPLLIALTGAVLIAIACSNQSGRISAEMQKQIALGEKVFNDKECGKCHSTTGTFSQAESSAPDLSSVFLAMDTVFVKAHLQFTEVSAMPPIPMTPSEMGALTQYIGSLHAKANTDPDLKDTDGTCPICGAPLKISEATANHLQVTFEGKNFYFECPDCKVVFERDPTWHARSGYASQ